MDKIINQIEKYLLTREYFSNIVILIFNTFLDIKRKNKNEINTYCRDLIYKIEKIELNKYRSNPLTQLKIINDLIYDIRDYFTYNNIEHKKKLSAGFSTYIIKNNKTILKLNSNEHYNLFINRENHNKSYYKLIIEYDDILNNLNHLPYYCIRKAIKIDNINIRILYCIYYEMPLYNYKLNKLLYLFFKKLMYKLYMFSFLEDNKNERFHLKKLSISLSEMLLKNKDSI